MIHYDHKLLEVWRRAAIDRPLPVVARSDPKFCGLAYYGGGLLIAWRGRGVWIDVDVDATASDSQVSMLRIGGHEMADCGGTMHPLFPMKDSKELRASLIGCRGLERRMILLRMNWWHRRKPEILDFYCGDACGAPPFSRWLEEFEARQQMNRYHMIVKSEQKSCTGSAR